MLVFAEFGRGPRKYTGGQYNEMLYFQPGTALARGATLRVAPVDDRGQLILEEYEKLLNPRTRLVAITQVSNALGTVTPVHEITQIAHRHGACVLIDGAQSVSHMTVDVQSIGCDFFVFWLKIARFTTTTARYFDTRQYVTRGIDFR
mgnify:CR=1 FL=1